MTASRRESIRTTSDMELRDLRAKITPEADQVLEAVSRASGKEKSELVREVLHEEPLLDLTAGYVQRSKDLMPRQGDRSPWKVRQNFVLDLLSSKLGDVTEDLVFDLQPSPADEAQRV